MYPQLRVFFTLYIEGYLASISMIFISVNLEIGLFCDRHHPLAVPWYYAA